MAFLAAAFEGAHRVPAEVIAASVVLLAFVNVWKEKQKGSKLVSKLKWVIGKTRQVLFHNFS